MQGWQSLVRSGHRVGREIVNGPTGTGRLKLSVRSADASSACWEKYRIRADEASALRTASRFTDTFQCIHRGSWFLRQQFAESFGRLIAINGNSCWVWDSCQLLHRPRIIFHRGLDDL